MTPIQDRPVCYECNGESVVLLSRPDDTEIVCRDCGTTRAPEDESDE